MNDVPGRLGAALSDRYAIERELGQGGMATVYLASDLRHHRKVALKVLRPELAAVLGPERFLSEIQTTANLQHPHLLPLFDSGEADGLLFYVMPYVQGESLRQRLERERQLPVEESVRITAAVAGALDYAHRHGVIHRDLKPENILLHEGQPLVADFGIALAVSNAGGARITQTGLSLGTPAYMSPEQATGDRHVDTRTDIYSPGAITYEMLVGDPPHTASTAQALIAKVLTEAPRSLRAARPSVPPHVVNAVEQALERLPADRWTSAGEFGEALEGRVVAPAPAGRERRISAPWRTWSTTVAAAALVAAVAAVGLARSNDPPGSEARYQLLLPQDAPLSFAATRRVGASLELSSDGEHLVWVAPYGSTTRLHIRDLRSGEERALEFTVGAYSPFFSPDGRWVGFFTGSFGTGELRKVAVDGGASVVVSSSVSGPRNGAWLNDDRIFVAAFEGGTPSVVASSGGPVQVLRQSSYATGFAGFLDPQPLPNTSWLLGRTWTGQLAVLSVEDGTLLGITRRGLVPIDSVRANEMIAGGVPHYVRSGHVIYVSAGGSLRAIPFDGEDLKVRGDPAPVQAGFRREPGRGIGHLGVSLDGTLIYAPGTDGSESRLALIDARGVIDTLGFPAADYQTLKLSPDGTRLLAAVQTDNYIEARILDLPSGRVVPLPVGTGMNVYAVEWLPDGKTVIARPTDPVNQFGGRGGVLSYSLETQSTRHIADGGLWWPSAHPRSDVVVGTRFDDSTRILHLDTPDETRIPIPGAAFDFSPDGRWLAAFLYASSTIAVIPFPYDGKQFRVTEPGFCSLPVWAPDGAALYYSCESREIWRVPFAPTGGPDGGPRIGAPARIARGPFGGPQDWTFDVMRDGHILVSLVDAEESTSRLEVITNFDKVLERLAPAGR